MLGYCTDIMDGPLDAATFRRAVDTIVEQAEILAGEIESGAIADYGGPDALRLLAAMVRLHGQSTQPISGHA